MILGGHFYCSFTAVVFMESSRSSRLASCYRITLYTIVLRVPLDSSQKIQQATNDVSQTGTEELVEDDLQVGGFSGYWSEVRAGTSRAFSTPVLSMLIPAAGLTGSW